MPGGYRLIIAINHRLESTGVESPEPKSLVMLLAFTACCIHNVAKFGVFRSVREESNSFKYYELKTTLCNRSGKMLILCLLAIIGLQTKIVSCGKF